MLISNRVIFAGLVAVSLGSLVSALILGDLYRLQLQPCYWCNFQRLLYILLVFFGSGGSIFPRGYKWWGSLVALTTLGGIAAAGRQSWMQYTPQTVVECGIGDPTLTEQLVDWLGEIWPAMFMVTGVCTEKEWKVLGLSLANWSGVCFFGLFCISLWVLFRRTK